MKRKTWRCFFCDEVFYSAKWAAEHFGARASASGTACQIKGHEGHLLTALRKAEAELAAYREEDTHLIRAFHALQAEHAQALQRMEEIGYARGLRDAGYSEAA